MELASPSDQRVLLGFKDAALEDKSSSWDVSKIGGLPDTLLHVTLLLPTCARCSAGLSHVAQVYCPLEGSAFHRVIHVFACCKKSCWGKQESWVVVRSQSLEGHKPQVTESLSQQENKMAATDWCDDADSWEAEDNMPLTVPANSNVTICPAVPLQTDCTSQLQSLSLSDTSEARQFCGPLFQSYYVAVAEEEECEWDTDLAHAERLLREYEQRGEQSMEEHDSCGGTGEGEKYEKSNLQNREHMFYKFLKKIAPSRQQILRYSWNGAPLYMNPPQDGFQPPPCARCSAQRVFELQLMPALVTMLHGAKSDLSLEFGTVLVFTCMRSCWEAGDKAPVQEYCIVQEDPDQRYFN